MDNEKPMNSDCAFAIVGHMAVTVLPPHYPFSLIHHPLV
jgi:hypothetical protein